ncbi:hypothetical protein ACWGID_15195 [Kribbella sp. NPDC054772]
MYANKRRPHKPAVKPAAKPIRPRRSPAAYRGQAVIHPAVERPVGPPIRLVVGPLPIRILRGIWRAVRRPFGKPDVPQPVQAVEAGPRCLHCKGRMAEKFREQPEPYGVWAVFSCGAASCPVCQGPCRNQSRMFLPSHWLSGPPGAISYL